MSATPQRLCTKPDSYSQRGHTARFSALSCICSSLALLGLHFITTSEYSIARFARRIAKCAKCLYVVTTHDILIDRLAQE